MCRRAFHFFLIAAILIMIRQGSSYQNPAQQKPSEQKSSEPKPKQKSPQPKPAEQPPPEQASPFQWLASSGETSGIKYPTHRLQPLSIQNESGLPVEIEKEEIKVDAQTTRITSRSYVTSVNGGRQLTETVVEEIQRMPGDRVHAIRTTSRKDANGRINPVQQEIQEMAASGADSYQVKKTLLLPGYSGTLIEKEQVQQTERKKGDKTVEIDRIRYTAGISGGWSASERWVSQNTVGEERTQSEEQVYLYDVNKGLSLNRQIQATEWKDSAGRHLQSESFARDLEGRLKLDSRTTMLQTPQRNGKQVTTETVERQSPAAPNEGLKMVRKIVENLKVVSPNQTQRQIEVLEPDLNGGMRSLENRQSIEVK